jgi:hypothetical protein
MMAFINGAVGMMRSPAAASGEPAAGGVAVDRALRASDIFGENVAPAPWPSSGPMLVMAIAQLSNIEDERAADLVDCLVHAILDRDDELRAVRVVLSEALALLHAQHTEIVQLQARVVALRGQLRIVRQELSAVGARMRAQQESVA